MKTFKVRQISTNKIVFEYIAESINAIDGLGIPSEDLEHIELSEEAVREQQIAAKAKIVKDEIKKKLLESDWTQLPDCFLTDENILEFRSYRNELRACLSEAEASPDEVVIPEAPEEIKRPV